MSQGSISKGLKMELIPLKPRYAQGGELPDFTVRLSNISMEPILFCSYMQEHRLLTTLSSEDIYVFYFGTTPCPPLQDSDIVTIGPDESVVVPLKVSGRQEYAFLCGTSLPAAFNRARGMEGFPPGARQFSASIGKFINIYQAPVGMHDFSMQILNIFENVPKGHLTVPLRNVWEGELTAACSVTFE